MRIILPRRKVIKETVQEPEKAPEQAKETIFIDDLAQEKEAAQPKEKRLGWKAETPEAKETRAGKKTAQREYRKTRKEQKKKEKAERKRLRRTERQKISALGALVRLLRFFGVILLVYLLQVSVMPYVSYKGVTPSLLIACVAVVTVTSGRLRAYWAGAVFGILTEAMLPVIPYFNLLLYPITAIFGGIFFADKSDKQLETERAQNKAVRNGNVYLRTIICSGVNALLCEAVHIVYIYLGNNALVVENLERGLQGVLLTMALTALVMLPLRCMLGFPHAPEEQKSGGGRYLRRRTAL